MYKQASVCLLKYVITLQIYVLFLKCQRFILFFCHHLFVECLVMFYKFLQFKVRPLLRLVMFPFKNLEPLFAYAVYQSLTQLMKMFGVETVVVATFGHAIVFVKPCGVASSTEIMRTVRLFKRKHPAACGAFEVFVAIGSAVPQPDV